MKHFLCFLNIVILLFFPLTPAFAHPGGLDAQLGHYDNNTGEYHFHHGYPAHEHINGICPYDFDDKTGEDSGASYGSDGYIYWHTAAPKLPVASGKASTLHNSSSSTSFLYALLTNPIAYLIGVPIFLYVLYRIISYISEMKEAEEAERQQQAYDREKLEKERFYSSHDLRTVCGIPDNIIVAREFYWGREEIVPYESDIPSGYKYGISIDAYTTTNCYHRRSCHHARPQLPDNAYLINRSKFHACGLCKPDPLPDMAWYVLLKDHLATCKAFGITPIIGTPTVPASIGVLPQEEKKVPKPVPISVRVLHPEPKPVSQSAPAPVPASAPVQPSKPIPAPQPVRHSTHSVALEGNPNKEAVPELSIPELVRIYRQRYSKTWLYVTKHAKNPEGYIWYYHQVWGRLQEARGDGIAFSTLTEEEQALVNYPKLTSMIYFASETSKTFHSTPSCYALLKTENPIMRNVEVYPEYRRCTKCIPPL